MSRAHASLAPFVAALVVLAPAGLALAQSFGSVSSLPPPKPAVAPATTAAPTQAPTVVQPAFTTAPVTAPVTAPATVPAIAPAAATPAVPAAGAATVRSPTSPAAAPFSSVSGVGGTAAAPAAGAGPSLPEAAAGRSSGFEMAERIVVEKARRRLLLLRGDEVIAAYPVRLGLNPYGHKLREGDFRTPEGSYHLARRNPRSEFFLSLEVSYPSEADRARARQAGQRPGGLIMIHGQPNVPRKTSDYYASNDWTDGCIAVSNSDMVDIWLRTRTGTPIDIRP